MTDIPAQMAASMFSYKNPNNRQETHPATIPAPALNILKLIQHPDLSMSVMFVIRNFLKLFLTFILFLLRFSSEQGRFYSNFLKFLHQFSTLVHLQQNITTSHKLSVKKHLQRKSLNKTWPSLSPHLWNSWPITVILDSLSNIFISQHIMTLIVDIMHSAENIAMK